MYARDIMTTQVVTVLADISIKEALKLIVELGLSGLVVINDKQEVVGVISQRDMMMAYDLLQDTKSPIEAFMKKDVVSVQPETPIEDVNKILIQSNVKRVPVMQGRKCVGVISRSDVLKYIYKITQN